MNLKVMFMKQELQKQREEEVLGLKQELESLNSQLDQLDLEVKKYNAGVKQMEEEIGTQTRQNTEKEENYKVKKRTLDLLPDAENNIAKLQVYLIFTVHIDYDLCLELFWGQFIQTYGRYLYTDTLHWHQLCLHSFPTILCSNLWHYFKELKLIIYYEIKCIYTFSPTLCTGTSFTFHWFQMTPCSLGLF